MTDTPAELARRLEKEGAKTVEFLVSVPPELWDRQIYSEGAAWKLVQLLAHFVETERAIPLLIERILDGGPGVPEDFDLDRYNASKVAKYDGQSPAELLRRFRELRARTVALVEKMSADDLEKTGRHPFLGEAPVGEMLRLLYLHLQLHQRDMRRVLKGA